MTADEQEARLTQITAELTNVMLILERRRPPTESLMTHKDCVAAMIRLQRERADLMDSVGLRGYIHRQRAAIYRHADTGATR